MVCVFATGLILGCRQVIGRKRRRLNSRAQEGESSANQDTHEFVGPPCTQDDCEVERRKLIFLDIDGPMAPWKNGKEHAWSASESLSDEPYRRHLDALTRIVNGAGGPEVVKVVISSNWRTDDERYPWLVAELGKHGIDVVGHTDVMKIHPARENNSVLARNLEIQRALKFRTLGAKGPCRRADGTNAFEPLPLPSTWEITAWVAIDDLDLNLPSLGGLGDILYLSRFIALPTDPDKGNGWMLPQDNFSTSVRAWANAFARSHFVKVDPARGLGGTPTAEARAIQLLRSS